MIRSFHYAARGVIAALKSERNLRIHMAIAFYVVAAGLITRLSAGEWIACLICIALVISSECMNTAVEAACDAVHPERSPVVKNVKDIAAGAVLVCAVISAIIGGLIFFRRDKIAAALLFFREHHAAVWLCLLTLAAWIKFIVTWGRKK